MVAEMLIADELDRGGDRQLIDKKRRCLGMVCTLDWALLQWSGESPLGSNEWVSPGEPRQYFPKGIATDPLNLKDPAGLKQRLLEVLAGRTDEIAALVPAQYRVPDLAEGIRTRAIGILAGLGGDGQLSPTFRAILAGDAPASEQAAAAMGLARGGAGGELLDWANKQRETAEGRLALLSVLHPSQSGEGGIRSPFPASFDQTALDLYEQATTPQERALAMRALVCRTESDRIRQRVLDVLETSRDVEVLTGALTFPVTVELAREERFTRAIAKLLTSEDLAVRLSAVARCADAPSPEFKRIVFELARTDDERVAREAIRALVTLSADDPSQALAAVSDVERRFGRSWRTAIAVASSRRQLEALRDRK
jgi:hypothetical protein